MIKIKSAQVQRTDFSLLELIGPHKLNCVFYEFYNAKFIDKNDCAIES